MKKFLLAVVMMVATTMIGFAQSTSKADTRTVEQRALGFVKNLDKELTLTDEQKTKIIVIQTAMITKTDEIKAKGADGDKKAMQKEIRAANEAGTADVKVLLTAEQKVKFDAWQERKKEEAKAKQNAKN